MSPPRLLILHDLIVGTAERPHERMWQYEARVHKQLQQVHETMQRIDCMVAFQQLSNNSSEAAATQHTGQD